MGRAHRYGDNIDTDVIIPARYLTTADPAELARHALEDLDPGFAARVAPGDVLVVGENFGCGSSREHAALALKGAGVKAVVGASFSRIFFRNAVNVGLPIVTAPEAVAGTEDGHEIKVDLDAGLVTNASTGESFRGEPVPDVVRDIAAVGGLVPWVRSRLENA